MKYLHNETKSRRNEILKYLYEHDNDFPIPLSHKTNLKQYLNKVICLGKSVICVDRNQIVGLIFYYDNNIQERKAFISLVSVDKNYRCKGIATHLIKEVLFLLKKQQFKICEVPTHGSNEQAIHLYYLLGFDETENIREDGTIILAKNVEE